MTTPEGWQRLGERVRARRHEMGWTQLDVVTQGGPSIDRIQAIEAARVTRYSSRTLAKLERGLRWEPGSVKAIVEDGGEPTPEEVGPRESAKDIAAGNRAELAELSEMLEQALAARRGRPLTETQRRVTAELADSIERTIDALDEDVG